MADSYEMAGQSNSTHQGDPMTTNESSPVLNRTCIAINAKSTVSLLCMLGPQLGQGSDDISTAILGQRSWDDLQGGTYSSEGARLCPLKPNPSCFSFSCCIRWYAGPSEGGVVVQVAHLADLSVVLLLEAEACMNHSEAGLQMQVSSNGALKGCSACRRS